MMPLAESSTHFAGGGSHESSMRNIREAEGRQSRTMSIFFSITMTSSQRPSMFISKTALEGKKGSSSGTASAIARATVDVTPAVQITNWLFIVKHCNQSTSDEIRSSPPKKKLRINFLPMFFWKKK